MKNISQKKYVGLFVVTSVAMVSLGIGALISACSTSQTKALREVEVGMTKSQVLNIVGDPARVGREHGQDRWVYVDHEDAADETTYVFFSEGRVTYVGPADEPIAHELTAPHENDTTVEAAPQSGKTSPAKPDSSQKFTPVDQ